jgi:anaerobic magnesium-protoporphyrin IX monomethyl ester cyclase
MKILLVNPPAGFSYGVLGISRPPLGLAYLAAILRKSHDIKIVDFNVEPVTWSKYSYSGFDIVGISVDTSRVTVSLKIAELAKRQGAVVVTGGPHVSFLDEEALASGAVDYVVRNEGEISFPSLVEFLNKTRSIEDVVGVSYLDNGVVRRTPDAPFIEDLDSLPFPARDLLPLESYKEKMNGRRMTTVVTSRGCPYNCEFCSSTRFFGVKWRARSAANIVEEVGLLYHKYGYRAIAFVDDNFTLNPARAIEISEMITAKGWDVIWSAMSRVDTIVRHPEMIQTMAGAGFRWTFIGFESGSQDALDAYGKGAKVSDAFKAMDILRQNHVEVTGAFILGAPDETAKMMKQTIKFARQLDPRRAQFSVLTPYPGSQLYRDVEGRLLTRDWDSYNGMHPTIRLNHVSSLGMRRIQVAAYSTFYGRPSKAVENLSYIVRAVPTLSGYLSLRAAAVSANLLSYPVLCAWKWFVSTGRHLAG